MTSLAVRPFQARDMTNVCQLILPIQQTEFRIAISATDQPDLSDIPSFYQSGTGGFWVAEHMGAIVGTIGLKDIGRKQAALRKMFVSSQFRGRDHGVAAKLLETLVAHAGRMGVADIYLGTTDAFLAAHRFYAKNGFAEIGKATLPDNFPVMSVDQKFFRLRLS